MSQSSLTELYTEKLRDAVGESTNGTPLLRLSKVLTLALEYEIEAFNKRLPALNEERATEGKKPLKKLIQQDIADRLGISHPMLVFLKNGADSYNNTKYPTTITLSEYKEALPNFFIVPEFQKVFTSAYYALEDSRKIEQPKIPLDRASRAATRPFQDVNDFIDIMKNEEPERQLGYFITNYQLRTHTMQEDMVKALGLDTKVELNSLKQGRIPSSMSKEKRVFPRFLSAMPGLPTPYYPVLADACKQMFGPKAGTEQEVADAMAKATENPDGRWVDQIVRTARSENIR